MPPPTRKGRKHKYRKGDIGFHHYAFRLRSRKDVDALQAFLEQQGAKIVDPAGEYYDDYYAMFFLDPDGMKLEGMKYGEKPRAGRPQARRRQEEAGSARNDRQAQLVGRGLGGAWPLRRKISMISAVDQPISMMPFSAVIGPSKCQCGKGSTSP